MADTKAKRAETVDLVPVSISQDSTFARAVADRIVPINLGRDLELACLQLEHKPISMLTNAVEQTISLTPSLTEVVRLRMGWETAINLTLQIMQLGLKDGLIDPEFLSTNVIKWTEGAKLPVINDGKTDAA